MDFEFPEEIVSFREKVREFAEREFTPELARKFDREEKYPDELKDRVIREKLVDPSDPWKTLVAIEELCRHDPGLGISATVPFFGEEVLLLFGSDEQKKKYLEKVNNGEAMMGLAVTEPGGGSDVAGIKTNAKDMGDHYLVNGSKMFITNGGIADYLVMLVRTSEPDEKRHHGLSTFLVETGWEGFKANKLVGKLGVRATNTAELQITNMKVPKENLIGEEGKGFYYIMTFFNISRVFVAAQGLGIAQGILDRSVRFVNEMSHEDEGYNREQIQFHLADIATRVEAARNLTYKAASFLFQFKPDPMITSMAKAYASEAAVFASEKAMEITGLFGLTSDLERYFRDAKITEIWEGTSEVERLIISRMLRKAQAGEQ
ncbi:acyl-CoA dehydrogenase [uncultured archaeon]|nr:acyl-CoA dehydrogenase [uncultured archaeon]